MKINSETMKKNYASLSNDELLELYNKRKELTDIALSALEEEIFKRDLTDKIEHFDSNETLQKDNTNNADSVSEPIVESVNSQESHKAEEDSPKNLCEIFFYIKDEISNIRSFSDFIVVMTGSVIVLLVYIGVGIFLFVLFFLLPILNIYCFYNSIRTYFWEETDGIITTSYISKSRSGNPNNGRYNYFHHLSYKYSVGNRTYTGKRVSYTYGIFGTMGRSSGKKRGIVTDYPIGKLVKVCYNPNKPENSVLEPGVGLWSVLEMSFFIFIAFLFIRFIISEIKYK